MSKTEEFQMLQEEMTNLELIDEVNKTVSKLCKDPRKWLMTIPPTIYDSDILICELADRFKKSIEENDQLKERVKELEEELKKKEQ